MHRWKLGKNEHFGLVNLLRIETFVLVHGTHMYVCTKLLTIELKTKTYIPRTYIKQKIYC